MYEYMLTKAEIEAKIGHVNAVVRKEVAEAKRTLAQIGQSCLANHSLVG